MTRKIRELIADLESAGFRNRGGKGSHRNFVHSNVVKPVTISGKSGDDAEVPRASCCEGYRGIQIMNTARRYVKIVEWSDEDNCFVGSCPGLFYGGCHGEDEKSVFAELCQIVEETIQLYQEEKRPLPPVTSGYDWANTIANTTATE